MVNEVITIETKVIDNVSGAFKQINKSVRNLGSGVSQTTEQVRGFNARGKKLSTNLTTNTKGLQKFQFEWLGVMFAGMAVFRVLGGIIRRQFELFGITEGLGSLFTILLIPAMEIISGLFWNIFGAITALNPETQAFIGWMIVLGAALSLGVFILGQFMLAWNSFAILILKFSPKIVAVARAISLAFAGMGLSVLAVVAVLIAVVAGMIIAWKNDFMGMRQVVKNVWNGIKGVISGVMNVIKGIVNVVLGILTGDFEKFGEGVKQIFRGLGEAIVNIFKLTGAAIAAVLIGVLQILKNIVNTFLKIGAGIGNVITGRGLTTEGAFQFQRGGIVPGRLGTPIPIIAHAGERIVPVGGSVNAPNITINATYDVKVSDRREFENMLRENNIRLTEDVRRLIKT